MKPNVLCVTGGMGSGKSLALELLKDRGWPVYPADVRAKQLVAQSVELQTKLVDAFGSDALDAHGQPNGAVLSTRAFASQDAWNTLNEIIHPSVHKDFVQWLTEEPQCNASWVARESALLFEVGATRACTLVLLITASEETRKQRIAARQPERNAEELYRRMSFQWSDERKIAQLRAGDWHVTNDGTVADFTKDLAEKIRSLMG
jgi:dephospho-CoA kinase